MGKYDPKDEWIKANELSDAKCHFCGQHKPDAYWAALGITIVICRWCGKEILPKLMADSLMHSDPNSGVVDAERFWDSASANYYKAVAWALDAFKKSNKPTLGRR